MQRETRIRILIAAVALLGASGEASAGFVEYFDAEKWEQALGGAFSTIGFADLPANTIVSDQYLEVGALFDGTDHTRFIRSIYPNDGFGLDGNGDIVVEFIQPISAIAAEYPGELRMELYEGEKLVYESSMFLKNTRPIGNFAGVVSPVQFDRAVLIDWGGSLGEAEIDDLHFGPPIPAAPALAGLALAGLWPGRIRRTM